MGYHILIALLYIVACCCPGHAAGETTSALRQLLEQFVDHAEQAGLIQPDGDVQLKRSSKRMLQQNGDQSPPSLDTLEAALWLEADEAQMRFGTAADVNLYRGRAKQLATDVDMSIGGNLHVKGSITNDKDSRSVNMMFPSADNVTAGDIVSLLNGNLYKGFGLSFTVAEATDRGSQTRIAWLSAQRLVVAYVPSGSSNTVQVRAVSVSKTSENTTRLVADSPGTISGCSSPQALRLAGLDADTFAISIQCGSSGLMYAGKVVRGSGGGALTVEFGTATTLVSSIVGAYSAPLAGVADGRFAVAYIEGVSGTPTAFIRSGRVETDKSVTLGTPKQLLPDAEHIAVTAFPGEAGRVLIAGRQLSPTNTGWIKGGRVQGTDFILEAVSAELHPDAVTHVSLQAVSQDKVLAAYRAPEEGNTALLKVIKVNHAQQNAFVGPSVVLGAANSVPGSYDMDMAAISQHKALAMYRLNSGRAFIRDIDIGDSGVVLGAERGVAPAEVSSFGCVAIEGRSFAMVFQNDKQFDQITMRAGTSQGGSMPLGLALQTTQAPALAQVAITGAARAPAGQTLVVGSSYIAGFDGTIGLDGEYGVILGRAVTASDVLIEWGSMNAALGGTTGGDGGSSSGTFTGEIRMFAGLAGTVPSGWLLCNGQSFSKAKYAALYAVIKDAYGGSGDTFAVPDFRGRGPTQADDTKPIGHQTTPTLTTLTYSNYFNYNNNKDSRNVKMTLDTHTLSVQFIIKT